MLFDKIQISSINGNRNRNTNNHFNNSKNLMEHPTPSKSNANLSINTLFNNDAHSSVSPAPASAPGTGTGTGTGTITFKNNSNNDIGLDIDMDIIEEEDQNEDNILFPPNASYINQLNQNNGNSGFRTPVNNLSLQSLINQQQQFGNNSVYMKNSNQGSNISLASSITDIQPSVKQQQYISTMSNNLSQPFVNLLLDVYQNYVSEPSTTPFDYSNPPSGVLNKVAKLSITESQIRNIDIGVEKNNWLLTLIRYRLSKEIKNDCNISRTSSNASLSPLPFAQDLLQFQFNNNNNNNISSNNNSNFLNAYSSSSASGIPSQNNLSLSTSGLQPAFMQDFGKPSPYTQELLSGGYSPVPTRPSTAIQLNRTRSNSSLLLFQKPSLSRSASSNGPPPPR
ncbi:hypothetical protein Kpol_1058p41 [Vanderwaltozyma polyspora DSM 70294]|uniref:Uncharacterized protein n=1 Tax=Vanderwaltozyma polyspora (strain ATCC 22028 / DSM 70294 / BCRC 21397 / CBS 2163 / NBRC 10782 / NRRL Y-8283 / UCD 57-17) TaxID=436907 RepID=A7TJS5_VANPO|nr:uncharacterized protein Kpol_1058p41 [Vanderwaltozyma polyspora DSM 70294]EDO17504.1 hypothetical protein Kpol_1058p41 [Vanderwaltozyma polyspora DSM 70294]